MKHTHTEGPGSILKSRFARGLFPLMAALLAFALAAPAAHAAAPTDFAKKMTLTPSTSAFAKIGETAWTDFPVLVRLPAEASALLQSANGTDLFFTDGNDASLPFEVETFDPAGTTFVWVKVPSLSVTTELTVWFGGASNQDNDPTAVWSRYVGVWHYAPSDAGGTTVADATGHGLTGSTTGTLSTYAGPFGGDAIHGTATVTAPNYDALVPNAGQFTASGWFKAPSQVGDYLTFVSKKTGLNWDDAKGWYLEMGQSKTKMNLVLGNIVTSATIRDVSANWNHFSIVSDGTNVRVYMNGSTSAAITNKAYAVTASGRDFVISPNKADNCTDEYRIRAGAASADETALEYATMADAAFFDMGEIESVDDTAQVFETPTVVRNANGTYTVTVVLSENSGDVGVIYDAGAASLTNIIATAANPGTYTNTPANLAADTTHAFAAYGKNANGTEVVAKGGVFYNGDISIAKISDANENGLVTGVFRISRADTAHDLTVTYTVGGSATAGQTYGTLSGTATIPAGSSSVDVEVVPLIDAQTTSDTTVTVTLTSGLYGVDAQASSAELTVKNLVVPAGFNTWVAAADGLASVGSNWSEGHAPQASENVLFDGRFSSANCEWDADATATVASWTQTNGYTGTVTVETLFPDGPDATFTVLSVIGDMWIGSGTVTHPAHTSAHAVDHWRLRLDVGGNLTIACGAKITASAKGSYNARSEGGSAYGGGFNYVVSWGDILEPYGVGSSANGNATAMPFAGGAIWIEVDGATTLDGSVLANGVSAKPNYDTFAGSGGSIYLKTATLSGSGTISANCEQTAYSSNHYTGAGGRISLLLTSGEMTTFPIANVTAFGGWAVNNGSVGASGTVVVRTPTYGNGILYARDRTSKNYGSYGFYPYKYATTGIPSGQTWTLDAVVFGANAILRIPTGTTLSLPNGLASVSGSSDLGANRGFCGILLDGGTLDIADTPATEHVVGNGQWMLSPNAPLVLNGNLTVQGGASVGAIRIRNSATNDYTKMDIVVKGNMSVASDGYILTEGAGLTGSDAASLFSGTTYGAHGGAVGCTSDSAAPTDVAYDSILSPSLPGNRGSNTARYGSGVGFLTVEGSLTLNGTASANAIGGHWYGAPGALNIVAGSLSGSGKITANGNEGSDWDADNNYHLYPGGGRISVRLTDANATFSDYWVTNILARGVAWNAGDGTRLHHSTAGTVYLQDGTQKEGAGTVRIFHNNRSVNWTTVCTNDFTAFPSTRHGGENDVLKMTGLSVGGGAHVFITKDVKIGSLEIDEHSTVNLFGHSLTVKSAKLRGKKLAPGKYTASSAAVSDFVVNTEDGAGGVLEVTGGGFVLLVR